jgi:tetratricopeptide (TPR) repeat protein
MEPDRPWIRPIVWAWIAAQACLVLARGTAAELERGPGQDNPPWKRQLGGEAAAQVAKLEQQIAQLRLEGRFTEAIEPAREVAEIRTRLQGADHWQTADARRAVDDLRKIATSAEDGRKAMASVGELVQKSVTERQRAHYCRIGANRPHPAGDSPEMAGEGHPDTAISYNNVAYNLQAQGRYAEAEPLYRQALAIWLKALGEGHPQTASGYDNVAGNLQAQGRYAEAEPLFRTALAIRLKALGEDHPDTAFSYNNLAGNLDDQGKHAEAEPLLRKDLAIRLRALGADHPRTATSYTNLASNLDAQGKHAEAVENWALAADILELTRGARGASGLERSVNPLGSPLPVLAIALARQGRPRDA